MEWIQENKIKLIMFLIFVFSIFGGIKMYSLFFPTQATENENNINIAQIEDTPENKIINFLLLGVDERKNDIGRSDTIIVLSVNMAKQRIGLISVPRDSRVDLGKYGKDKINHAYAYGGVNLVKNTIEKELNLKIDDYVVFNFNNFKNIIDTIGGVNLLVEKNMYYRDDYDGENGFIINLTSGYQHLDGDKAIQYVRYRDEEGDIGRVRRQQNFLSAVTDKMTNPSTIIKLPIIAREFISSTKTSVSFSTVTKLFNYLKDGQKYTISSTMVAGHPEMIDDISYWIIDKEKTMEDFKKINNFANGNDIESLVASSEHVTPEQSIFKEKEEKTEIIDVNDYETSNKDIEKIKQQLLKEEKRPTINQRVPQKKPAPVVDKNAITIINTTDNPLLVTEFANILEQNGLTVGNVNQKTSGKSNDRTILVVNSEDTAIIEASKNFPFKFTIIFKNAKDNPTLIIGSQY